MPPAISSSSAPVLIHIGQGKAGSTTLQYSLMENAHRLREAGIIVHGGDHHRGNALPLALALWGQGPDQPLESFRQALDTYSDRTLCVSSEMLLTLPTENILRLKSVLGHREARIIVYVRNYVDITRSTLVFDSASGRNLKDVDQYFGKYWSDPKQSMRAAIERWVKVFGKDHVRVRSLEDVSSLEGGGLLRDFSNALGAELPVRPPANVSAHWMEAEFRRACSIIAGKRFLAANSDPLRATCELFRGCIDGRVAPPQFFSLAQRQFLTELYTADTLALGRLADSIIAPLAEPDPASERHELPSLLLMPRADRDQFISRWSDRSFELNQDSVVRKSVSTLVERWLAGETPAPLFDQGIIGESWTPAWRQSTRAARHTRLSERLIRMESRDGEWAEHRIPVNGLCIDQLEFEFPELPAGSNSIQLLGLETNRPGHFFWTTLAKDGEPYGPEDSGHWIANPRDMGMVGTPVRPDIDEVVVRFWSDKPSHAMVKLKAPKTMFRTKSQPTPASTVTEASAPPTTGVCFESDEIQVLHCDGASDFLLVTFSTLHDRPDGSSFWAKGFAQKNGIAALGFVAKRSNWFPVKDIEAAVTQMGHILARRPRVVAYGSSMGAYAVLKHGKRLGAEVAIAFSPQYSIDPSDVAAFDNRFYCHFHPEVRGGCAITSDDLCPRNIVFYDPYYREDRMNIDRIQQLDGSVSLIATPMMQHFPISLFAGREVGVRLLKDSLAGDVESIRRTTQSRRRSSPMRLPFLLDRLSQRDPDAASALFARYGERLERPEATWLSGQLGQAFFARGRLDEARQFFSSAVEHGPANVTCLLRLSSIAAQEKDYQVAESWARRAVEANPELASSHNTLAGNLIALGRLDEAEEALLKAVELAPSVGDFMRRLSAISLRRGNSAAAVDWAHRAIEVDPLNLAAHRDLVRLQLYLGHLDDAEHAACVALEMFPENSDLLSCRTEVQERRKTMPTEGIAAG